MSITVLSDVIISNGVIAAGVRGKQRRRNSRVTVDNGAEFINIVWSQTLREYEIGIVPLRREAWMEIEGLHEVTEGGAYGFLLEDPKDHSVTVDTGVATELTSTTFQLYRRYTERVSGRTKDRKITRPRATGFALYISGVLAGPGDYSLDDETGIVTIAASPDAEDITWAGRFLVPVHFMDDSIDWDLVATGPDADSRFLAGPSCVLQEVRE
jgi:uncharacterized protein (TIGR02217 family)